MLKWTLAAFLAFPVMAQADNSKLHTGELLYKLKSTKSSFSLGVIRPNTKTSIENLKTQMEESGQYDFVAYNTIETLPDSDTDLPVQADVSNQWHHSKIHTVPAWPLANQNSKITVAVCDSGVQSNHEDLAGQLLKGWNLVDNNDDLSVTTSHGTFVAGLISARADEMGVVGVAPFVKILPLRISDANGSATMELIVSCIKMGVDAGAKVINVSFTGVNSPAVQAAGKYAADNGALLVYAAGNQGRLRSSKTYPDYKNVLVVGATKIGDTRWRWYNTKEDWGGSNYGLFIDLMAPGHNLFSTNVYDEALPEFTKYRSGSGTSFAAPVVSAVAALIYSVNPKFTPREVELILLRSADTMGSSQFYGAGRVNALKALELARKSVTFVQSR